MMTGIILIILLKNALCDLLPKIVNKKEFLVTKKCPWNKRSVLEKKTRTWVIFLLQENDACEKCTKVAQTSIFEINK